MKQRKQKISSPCRRTLRARSPARVSGVSLIQVCIALACACSVVTAYTYPSAVHVDAADIDVLLVGDSVGMVELGYDTTLPVTVEDVRTQQQQQQQQRTLRE